VELSPQEPGGTSAHARRLWRLLVVHWEPVHAHLPVHHAATRPVELGQRQLLLRRRVVLPQQLLVLLQEVDKINLDRNPGLTRDLRHG